MYRDRACRNWAGHGDREAQLLFPVTLSLLLLKPCVLPSLSLRVDLVVLGLASAPNMIHPQVAELRLAGAESVAADLESQMVWFLMDVGNVL